MALEQIRRWDGTSTPPMARNLNPNVDTAFLGDITFANGADRVLQVAAASGSVGRGVGLIAGAGDPVGAGTQGGMARLVGGNAQGAGDNDGGSTLLQQGSPTGIGEFGKSWVTRINDGADGPELVLFHNSSSPATSDHIGLLTFQGADSIGAPINYATLIGEILNPTNGATQGQLAAELEHIGAGTPIRILEMRHCGDVAADESGIKFFPSVNKAGGAYIGLELDVLEDVSVGVADRLVAIRKNAVDHFYITSDGEVVMQNVADAASNPVASFGGGTRLVPADGDRIQLNFLFDSSTTPQQNFGFLEPFAERINHADRAGGLRINCYQAGSPVEYVEMVGDLTGADRGEVAWNTKTKNITYKWGTVATEQALHIDGFTGDVRTARVLFHDEFWNGTESVWISKDSTGIRSDLDESNGIHRLQTGAVDDDAESIYWDNVCQFSNTERPTFEAGFRIDQVSDIRVFVGLIEADGGGDDDYIRFELDSDVDTNWRLICDDSTGPASDVGAAATTNMTAFRFVFLTDTTLEWFISTDNGETWLSQGTVVTKVPTVQLQPIAYVQVRADGGARQLDLDYITIHQDRG